MSSAATVFIAWGSRAISASVNTLLTPSGVYHKKHLFMVNSMEWNNIHTNMVKGWCEITGHSQVLSGDSKALDYSFLLSQRSLEV